MNLSTSLVESSSDAAIMAAVSTAIDGVKTPELQVADNDYAVGLLIQKIANSIYARNTLIFVVEDDSQDGADHVDSHRTTAFVAGAYVKQGAVVSTPCNTIDFIQTMEEVLGLKRFLNLNDALGHPLADIFTTTPQPWTFTASPSAYLYATQLPLPVPAAGMKIPRSTHDAQYWARVTRGLDLSHADRVDPLLYNRIIGKGVMHNKPVPASRMGKHAPDEDDESIVGIAGVRNHALQWLFPLRNPQQQVFVARVKGKRYLRCPHRVYRYSENARAALIRTVMDAATTVDIGQ